MVSTGAVNGSILLEANGGNASATNSGNIIGGLLSTTTIGGGNATSINNGTIDAGGFSGILATPDGGGTAVATNNGTVTNAQVGIFTNVNVAGGTFITNTGTISATATGATQYGIQALSNNLGNITITIGNSGQIASGAYGVFAFAEAGDVAVTNSGAVTAAQYGIQADTTTGNVTITNLGKVQGDTIGILASPDHGNALVVNAGTVSSSQTGILANASHGSAKVQNFGSVVAGTFGILNTIGSSGGTAQTDNFGSVSGTQYGIDTEAILGNAVINNTGTVSGGQFGVYTRAANGGSSSVTNSGTIVGAIGIDANTASSIVNSGTITGTGGTAIAFEAAGNTLTLEPGSVVNGTAHGFGADTFQLGGTGSDRLDAGLLATQFAGFATFNKIGNSTWTLTGINAMALPWVISGGILNVNGTLANSTMTVDAGGALAGRGTIGNTSIAGGSLAPGDATGSAFGPLTVQGNLSFTAASAYLIQVAPANASRTNVTGAATLGGAAVAAIFLPGSIVNKQYIILNATGGVNGTFNPAVTTNLTNFQSTLSYDANDVFLNTTLSYVSAGGLNVNQQNVGNALANFFNTSGGIPLVFGALTPAGLTQASGEAATGSQQTTFDAMGMFMGLLTDPFIAGRGDGVSSPSGAPQFADENDSASAYASNGKLRSKGERDAYAAIYGKAPPAVDLFAQRWSVWAAGFGGSQTTDGNATLGSSTATSRIAGTAVGADYRFSPFTLAGFALAGGGTNFSVANGGTGRSDLFQAGAFIRHNVGPAYISGALAYGWQDITTDRTVTIAGVDRLRAEFNANAWSGRVESGYRFVSPWTGGIGITPYAAGQFTTFDLPAYAEQVLSGTSTFALAYGSKNVTDTRSELGVRSDKSFAMQDGIFTLRGRLAWAHDFNPDRNIAATFQALPGASFVVNGAAQASESALTTASAEMKWLNGWSAAATFEGEFSNVTRSYAGKGVVRYAW